MEKNSLFHWLKIILFALIANLLAFSMLFDQKPIRWITIFPLKLYMISVWYIRSYLFQTTSMKLSLRNVDVDGDQLFKLVFLLFLNHPIFEIDIEMNAFNDFNLVLKNSHLKKLEASFLTLTPIFLCKVDFELRPFSRVVPKVN